jgi:hypothetical protein
MGRGSTPYVEIVPRENNPNGARVKMMRPRRVYVGAGVERLFAEYLAQLACRAGEFGLALTADAPLLVNLARPPLLAALREGTVRDKTAALHRKGASARRSGPRIGSGTATPPLCCWPGPRSGWCPGGWATPTCRPRSISTAGSARTRRCVPQRTGQGTPAAGRFTMATDGPRQLRPAEGLDPIWRLWQDLPPQWRGPVIGPAIPDWETAPGEDERKINLTGLPDPFPAELAWMAHWQEMVDGTRASVQPINQLALILRRALRLNHPFPDSIRAMDVDTAEGLLGWFYATRWGRLPPANTRFRLRSMFRIARLALIARCHEGPWWELDDWHPRCDPRIQ